MRGPSGLFVFDQNRHGAAAASCRSRKPQLQPSRPERRSWGDLRASPPVSIASDLDEIEEDHPGLAFGMRRAGHHAAGRAASH